jgi:hypothetical protein
VPVRGKYTEGRPNSILDIRKGKEKTGPSMLWKDADVKD